MIATKPRQNLESLSEGSDNGNGNGNGKPKYLSDIYFSDMGNHPVLTREQEIELFKRIEETTIVYKQKIAPMTEEEKEASQEIKKIEQEIKDAKHEMIMHNLPLVISITKRYRNFGVPFEDLIQEGNFALLRAVNHYDLKKKTTFSTYLTRCVIHAISRELKKSNKANRIASLDDSVGEQGNLDYLDLIPDSKAHEPGEDSELVKNENEEYLRSLAYQLNPIAGYIIESRLLGEKKKTLYKIGEELGLSKERVRQLQNRALRQLRAPVEAAGFG